MAFQVDKLFFRQTTAGNQQIHGGRRQGIFHQVIGQVIVERYKEPQRAGANLLLQTAVHFLQ